MGRLEGDEARFMPVALACLVVPKCPDLEALQEVARRVEPDLVAAAAANGEDLSGSDWWVGALPPDVPWEKMREVVPQDMQDRVDAELLTNPDWTVVVIGLGKAADDE